jgi:hypothetical protein
MASASSGGSAPAPAPAVTPVSVTLGPDTYFYSTSTGKTYSSDQMLPLFGINVETIDIVVLNGRSFYPVVPSAPDFDTLLYNTSSTWSIVPLTPSGEGAQLSYTAVAKPLPEAKENASGELKQSANSQTATIVANSQVSPEVLTSVASQDPFTRSPFLQDTLDQMDAVSVALGDNLAAVDAATTVDEINCIVQGASGIIVTGRGGAGPDDMQPSYFTDLQGLPPGVGEPELEIYIPGTDTVISYDAGLPDPYKFDSAGDCYNTGDYRTTIRVAATGQVLSTVYPAEGPAVPVAWTYNPVIPSLGGGSSSSSRS